MADDELVSFWDVVHPPRQFPECVEELDLVPPPKPKPPPPFCYRCGLPSRICDGSEHRRMQSSKDIHQWHVHEEFLFLGKARFLTEEEKGLLRTKLYHLRTHPGESVDQWSGMRGDLIRAGRIPLGRWRIELYQRVLGTEED